MTTEDLGGVPSMLYNNMLLPDLPREMNIPTLVFCPTNFFWNQISGFSRNLSSRTPIPWNGKNSLLWHRAKACLHRYDLSHTTVILAYENECCCQIFAHLLMAKFEIWRSYSITYARVRIVYSKSYRVDSPPTNWRIVFQLYSYSLIGIYNCFSGMYVPYSCIQQKRHHINSTLYCNVLC